MSLDIYLTRERKISYTDGTDTITEDEPVYDTNITHNLGTMAKAVGIYKALWRPEELDIDTAGDLIPLLELGLHVLKEAPEYYKQYNAENGWGLYKHFVPFVENYLIACKQYPQSKIAISR